MTIYQATDWEVYIQYIDTESGELDPVPEDPGWEPFSAQLAQLKKLDSNYRDYNSEYEVIFWRRKKQ